VRQFCERCPLSSEVPPLVPAAAAEAGLSKTQLAFQRISLTGASTNFSLEAKFLYPSQQTRFSNPFQRPRWKASSWPRFFLTPHRRGHSLLNLEVAMIPMDSLNSSVLCPRCGCTAFHSNSRECIDALRRQIDKLTFKRSTLVERARLHREVNTPGRYADTKIPRHIAG
jgi:hypothetical protein